jgi:hypothetical protein
MIVASTSMVAIFSPAQRRAFFGDITHLANRQFTLPGTSSDRAARATSGIPPSAVTHSSNGSGSNSNRNSPSARTDHGTAYVRLVLGAAG